MSAQSGEWALATMDGGIISLHDTRADALRATGLLNYTRERQAEVWVYTEKVDHGGVASTYYIGRPIRMVQAGFTMGGRWTRSDDTNAAWPKSRRAAQSKQGTP